MTAPPTTPAPAAPKTDEQQWEADWSDPTYKAWQHSFAGDNRPKGTPKERYVALCPL